MSSKYLERKDCIHFVICDNEGYICDDLCGMYETKNNKVETAWEMLKKLISKKPEIEYYLKDYLKSNQGTVDQEEKTGDEIIIEFILDYSEREAIEIMQKIEKELKE